MAKDSPRTTAGELQRLVESQSEKIFKKFVKQPLHHHTLFVRVSRKMIRNHPKTNSSIFSYQTRLELQMGLASMVRLNKRISFLDEFGEHRDKTFPMSRIKLEWFWMKEWALIPGQVFI